MSLQGFPWHIEYVPIQKRADYYKSQPSPNPPRPPRPQKSIEKHEWTDWSQYGKYKN